MSEYSQILVEHVDGVTTITLNRPDTLNALGMVNGTELIDALRKADDDDDVRCVVLTGSGRGFCAGADLKEMMDNRPDLEKPGQPLKGSRVDAMSPLGFWNKILNVMRGYHKPLIASINGLAVGGGMLLACASDIRIASDDARFSAIFAKRGMAFEAGTSYYLPRLIGLENTYRMVYTGDMVNAADALRMGLVGEVVPADQLADHIAKFAARIAQMPTLQLALARMEIQKSMSNDDPNAQMMIEMYALNVASHTADYEEGHVSFIEKRDARFIGR